MTTATSFDSVDAWPTLADVHGYLRHCATTFERYVTLTRCGESVEQRPIYAITVTDPAHDASDKQSALIVAAEHGTEHSGTVAALRLLHWLLHDDEGRATLAQQTVRLVPVVNVDRYDSDDALLNANGVNLWADYHYDGSPPSQPESRALWELMETTQPDLFLSLHGTSEDWEARGYHRTWESTGIAYTNAYARSYNRKVIDRINRPAEAAGFPMDLGEEDLERILPLLPGRHAHHSMTTANHYAGSPDFAYQRYHSLAMVMEIAYPESGFLRCREAVRLGNAAWEYEDLPGYPNRIITAACLSRLTLVAGGSSAAERRASRVRLWQHSQNLLIGMTPNHPTHIGGFASRREEDFTALQQWTNTPDTLLRHWKNDDLTFPETERTLEAAGLLDKSALGWSDGFGVSRCREREEGRGFEAIGYNPALRTPNAPMAAALRFRIDRRTRPRRAILNDEPAPFRHWTDRRYGYVEIQLRPDWQRAVFVIETTPVPGFRAT